MAVVKLKRIAKRAVAAVAVISACTILIAGDSAEIVFIVGTPAISDNGKAIDPAVGAKIPLTSQIRTANACTVVVRYNDLQYKISPNSVVSLNGVIEKKKEGQSVLRRFFDSLVKNPDKKRFYATQAASVRAEDGNEDMVEWDVGGLSGEGTAGNERAKSCWKMMDDKEYEGIVEKLKSPRTDEEWAIRGLAYYKMNKIHEAEASLKKSLQMTTTQSIYNQVSVTLSYIHMNRGEFRESLASLNKILARSQEKTVPEEVWGLLVVNSGYVGDDFKEALYRKKMKRYYPNSKLLRALEH